MELVVLLNDPIWLFGTVLFISFVAIMIIFSVFFVKRAHESSQQRVSNDVYGYGIAFFYLLISIGYIIRTYFMFFLPDEFTFIYNLTSSGRLDPSVQLFWQVHMFVVFLGISLLMIGVENQVFTKSHYFFSIISLVFAPLLVILPYDLAHLIYFFPMGTPIVIIIIYLYVGIQNPGSIRKNSFAIVVGWLVFVLGITLNSTTVRAFLTPEIYPIHPYAKMLFFYNQFDLPGLMAYLMTILSAETSAIIPAILAPITLICGFLIQAAGYSRKFD